VYVLEPRDNKEGRLEGCGKGGKGGFVPQAVDGRYSMQSTLEKGDG